MSATTFRPNNPISEGSTRTDADGRFTFDGLNEGTINIFVADDEVKTAWTYRAAQDVELKSGWTERR